MQFRHFYFSQAPSGTKEIIQVNPDEPIPVTPVPSPTSFLGYGVNSIILILTFYIFRPLLDKLFMTFNTKAKLDKEREDREFDLNFKQAENIARTLNENQAFMQAMLKAQNDAIASNFNDAVDDMGNQLKSIYDEMQKQTIVMQRLAENAGKYNHTEIEHILTSSKEQFTLIANETKKQTQLMQTAITTFSNITVQIDNPITVRKEMG
jgi:hypothetical protein